MIAHRLSDKNLHQLVRELLTRGRKLNISLVCITASYFAIPKIIIHNSTHYLIRKISNKKELQ